jgi:hypothetical protein
MNTATQVELWLRELAAGPQQPADVSAAAVAGAHGRLADAEAELCRAWRRLQMVRSAAFNDEYDPDACETAALLYRRAVHDVHQARDACAASPAAPAAPPAPAAPTPRLRFARWLVENGRLSEGVA